MTGEAKAPRARRREARDPNVLAFVGMDPHILAQMRSIFAAAATPRELDCYPDVATALAGISRRPPVAILVDLGMPGGYGPYALHHLRRRFPRLPLIALAPANDTDAILLALITGAVGCVVQPAPAESLMRAINEVLKDGVALCSKTQAQLVRCLASIPSAASGGAWLSPREEQISVGVLHHRTNQEIADTLGIGRATVETHMARLFKKFAVHSRHELISRLLRRS